MDNETIDVLNEVSAEIVNTTACKAEQRGHNVLVLKKLSEPIRRFDGKMARFQLEHRWLSNVDDVHSVQGNDFTYWMLKEVKGWETKSLFDMFDMIG